MEHIQEKAKVPAIVALLAVFIALYSLWGASLLHKQEALSQGTGASVATNL